MKKTLAVLAVLAVAAVAQAELLATWNISASSQSVQDNSAEYAPAANIHFGTLTASEGVGYGSANGTAFRSNNWAQEGQIKDGHYIQTAFTLDESYTFTLEKVEVPFSLGNPGAAHFIWKDENGTAVTASSGPTASGKSTITFAAAGSPTWSSDGALRMYAADGLTVGSGNASSGSRTDISSGMKVYGTVAQGSAVPEPATMSLLGLGALAMALRRKLRK